MGELFREFRVTFSEDGPFDRANSIEAPECIGDGLHESAFARADGLVFELELMDVVLVSGDIIGRKQNGAAGEAGFDRLEPVGRISKPGQAGRVALWISGGYCVVARELPQAADACAAL